MKSPRSSGRSGGDDDGDDHHHHHDDDHHHHHHHYHQHNHHHEHNHDLKITALSYSLTILTTQQSENGRVANTKTVAPT